MLSKLRFSRGPLRWWIMVAGLLFGNVTLAGFGIGTVLIVLGAALHVGSKAALWQNRQLSTDGPYRFTRNPFYLANLLIDGGLLVVIGRWEIAMPAVAAWIWVYHRTIAAEEATLRSLFGEAFDAYCRRVPRFVPFPKRYLSRDEITGPRWTWSNPNLATGKEWTRACRVLMCPWLLLAAAMARQATDFESTALGLGLAMAMACVWLFAGTLASPRKRPHLGTESP
ncbi:MAG: isoprenylcysteine carboxylmethyltransferase family protein [Planctomycetia bacterium]|nr:isoprenylcysteine carboxylmethyltransferase family protein [Planctomycetia bacterium]